MESLADVGLVTVQRFKLLEEEQREPVTSQIQEWPANLFRAQFDRFELWAVNLGLFVMGHGSLDYRIRDSESMRESIYKMIQNLNRSLDDVLDYVNGNTDQGDEDSDTDSEPESDIDLLLGSIKDPIDRLYKLAVWIRNPATRLASSKARNFKQIDEYSNIDLFESYKNHDYDYVSSLFLEYEKHRAMQENTSVECKEKASVSGDGEVDSSDHVWEPVRGVLSLYKEKVSKGAESYLVQRIARANGRRRQQFAYWKKHKDKLREHASSFVEAPTRQLTDEEHIINGLIGETKTPLSVTTATQLRLAQAAGQEILEKEGVLKLDVSEYAPSAWNPSKDTVSFPPPPKIPTSDNFFECPYCFTICPISLLSEKAWRAHIIRDLRPYVCTYEQCLNSEQLYDTRDDWIQHEMSTHQRIFRCFEHEEEIFTTMAAYDEHIREYHGQNAVSSKFATSIMRNAHRSCPVCSVVLGSIQKLQSHIALHLERFAMFALPRHTDNTEEQSEAESQSDNAQLESNSFLTADLQTAWDVPELPTVPSIHPELELTKGSLPVPEALLPIYGQIITIKRCLLEVRDSGGLSSVEELYPYTMKLNSIDNLRVDGKFVVNGDILEGQGIVSELFDECFDLIYDLGATLAGATADMAKHSPASDFSVLSRYLEDGRLDEMGVIAIASRQELAGGDKQVNNYMKRVKSHFRDKPEIYERFLEIIQVYQREQSQTQDLISQMDTIFNSAPELLEDFKTIISKLNSSVSNSEDKQRRGPVKFNDAIEYVNKVKLHFHDKPEIYKQFLEIVNSWQREKYPVEDIYAQLGTLFNSAPEFLEEFNISFLEQGAAAGSSYTSQLHEPAHVGSSPERDQGNAHRQEEPRIAQTSVDNNDDDKSDNPDEQTLRIPDPFGSGRESPTMTSAENSQTALEDFEDIMQSRPPMVRNKSGELVQPVVRGHERSSSLPDDVDYDSLPEVVQHFPSDVQPLPAGKDSSPVEDFKSDTGSKSGHTVSATKRVEDDTHRDADTEAYEERQVKRFVEEEVETFGLMWRYLNNDVDKEIEFENEDAHGGPEARDLARKMEIVRLEVEALKAQFDKETLREPKNEKARELSNKIRSWDLNYVQQGIKDIQANREKRNAKMELEKLETWDKALADELDRNPALVDEVIREAKEAAEKGGAEPDPIKFEDAVGRKFSFPFHLCNTWQGMEELIKQAFLHVDVIGPHVQEGHYGLTGPDGEIILPAVWDKVIEPGWTITMTMWPLGEAPSVNNSQYSPPPYPGFAPVGPNQDSMSSKSKKKGIKRKSDKNDPRSPISRLDNGSDGDAENSDEENSGGKNSDAERGDAANDAVINASSKKLDEIGDELRLKWLPLCLNYIDATPKDPKKREDDHRELYENILQQVILKLDAVETEGIHEIRQRRKELVRETSELLKRLDVAKASSEARGEDTAEMSKKEEEEEEADETEKAARVQLQELAQANANFWPRMSDMSMDKAEEKRKDAETEEKETAREDVVRLREEGARHPCPYPGCGKSFGTETHLQRHINDRHENEKRKNFHCSIIGCDYSKAGGKAFPRKANWKRHMMKIHNIDQQSLPEPVEVDFIIVQQIRTSVAITKSGVNEGEYT